MILHMFSWRKIQVGAQTFGQDAWKPTESTSSQTSTSEPSSPWPFLPNKWPNKHHSTWNILPRPQATRAYPIIIHPIDILHKTALTPHPTRPAAIDVIQCKRLLECGLWRFNPSAVAFDTFDGVGAQDYTVSLFLFHLQMSFYINFANN